MKKVAIFLSGLFFILSVTGLAFAQEKAKPGKPSESTQDKMSQGGEIKQKATPKLEEYRMGGIVTKIDSAGKKITIKQSKVKGERVATLKMGKTSTKEMSMINVGDVVDVWFQGKTIKSLKKVD
jgi:hypothetical protein